ASPDGNTVFVINDDRLRRCMTPYAGVQRGAPAYGGGIFLDYIPARTFVQQYVQQSMLRDAGAQLTQVIRQRPRPDLSAAANQQFAQYNANPAGPTRAEHAEMEFTALRNGRRLAGYLLAETYFTPSPAGVGHIWGAAVFGLLAPEESMIDMMQALVRIAGSAQVSSQWAQSTQAAGQATQQAFHQAAQQMDQIITSSYWARQTPSPGPNGERRLSSSEKWSDMMRGQVHLTDGEGTEYVAPSGSNYYWYHGPHDLIIGKDEPTPPNIDVTQLQIIQ
ncbi:MAG: hypothetical protein JO022_12890, partial [Acidobacteriaceae bacterium]|nr:hypothetical protein [Acidobacteriaceae bacterium]